MSPPAPPNGVRYPVLWQAATPAGIGRATIPQGAESTGKLYFDVVGQAPTQVVYTHAGTDLLWT